MAPYARELEIFGWSRPSSGFDGVNEDANVRANAAVVDRHADVRASVMMTVDIDDDGDDGNFVDTLSEILGSFELVMRLLCTVFS